MDFDELLLQAPSDTFDGRIKKIPELIRHDKTIDSDSISVYQKIEMYAYLRNAVHTLLDPNASEQEHLAYGFVEENMSKGMKVDNLRDNVLLPVLNLDAKNGNKACIRKLFGDEQNNLYLGYRFKNIILPDGYRSILALNNAKISEPNYPSHDLYTAMQEARDLDNGFTPKTKNLLKTEYPKLDLEESIHDFANYIQDLHRSSDKQYQINKLNPAIEVFVEEYSTD